VQAAFPDRFKRDDDGRLYEIDARMVNFVSATNEQFRWGANYRRAFGQPKGAATATPTLMTTTAQVMTANGPATVVVSSDGGDGLSGAGWRLNANFTHQWQMAYERLMRRGLPRVDLLAGGAGFGTGQWRHRVNGTIGLAYNGTGAQLNSVWSSATHLDTGSASAPNRLDFSDTLYVNLQAFTNLATLYPASKALKGVRISLSVDNVLDFQQKVRDQNGVTPLRYQPYLMNPLGRAVSLSFRKAFS
jgi:hypothetical protein